MIITKRVSSYKDVELSHMRTMVQEYESQHLIINDRYNFGNIW